MEASRGTSAEFSERLRRLRLIRGWSQTELAVRAHTSIATISNVERGKVRPTAEQLDAIAAALGYSPEFLQAELRMLPTTQPWLRAYADAGRREAKARRAFATTAAEYIRKLNLRPLPELIPSFDGDPDDGDAIEDVAAEARELAELEPGDRVGNAVRAAERLGCVVLPMESELGRHLGMSVRADDIPIVFVAKADVPGDRQRWTVAHELGHLTLHRDAPPPTSPAEATALEKQAHRFAAAFLTPAEDVTETLVEAGGAVTLVALAKVKEAWGVSIKSLVGRFKTLGVIDDSHARSLYKQISARKWTKSEPVYVPVESAQWFERSLCRRASLGNVRSAAAKLAGEVGGNAGDLATFADWRATEPAEVVDLATRRRARGEG